MILDVSGSARADMVSPGSKGGVLILELSQISSGETGFTVTTTVSPAYPSARRVVTVERCCTEEAATILEDLFLKVDIKSFDYSIHRRFLSENKNVTGMVVLLCL